MRPRLGFSLTTWIDFPARSVLLSEYSSMKMFFAARRSASCVNLA